MTVNVISRKPFESKTYEYVSSIELDPSNTHVVIVGQYPGETGYSITYDRYEVVLNVNTREA